MQIDQEARIKGRLPAFQRHPRNCWYIAAGAAEIGDKPLRRELLGEFVMLFRDAAGKVAAARDACPHRGFPISQAHLANGVLQCRYHGIRFDGAGRCVGIPNNPGAPITDAMRLHTYPVLEKWLWIWIWMGDPTLADPSIIPDVDIEVDAGYDNAFLSPVGPHPGNAQLIRENLCDSSHVSYLHAALVDAPDDAAMTTPRNILRADDRTLLFGADMPDFVTHEDSAAFFNLAPGRSYYFRQRAWHYVPGLCVVHSRFYLPETRVSDDDLGPVVSDHTVTIGITPANDRMFYHMTALSSNKPQTQAQKDLLLYVIQQDVDAAEMMQGYFERHWRDAAEVSVPSDRIGLVMRRMVATMVKAEDAPQPELAAAD